MRMKACIKSGCGRTLPEVCFGGDSSRSDNKNPMCRGCVRVKSKKTYCKDKQYAHRLAQKYGLTVSERDGILFSQDWSCAICEKKDAGGRGKFHVDHNHETGEVRGLLCAQCNTGLGKLGDSIKTLKKAIKYLEEKGSYGH